MSGRALVIDDDQSTCELLEVMLQRQGLEVEWRTSALDALELVAASEFDVILTDLGMASLSGVELCERVLGIRPDVPVIVVTGNASLAAAVGAIRAGAYDFINEPVDTELLKISVASAISHRRLHEEVKRLRFTSGGEISHDLLGQSLAMRRVHDLISRVATSDASVLVHGETGTGKELIARALHGASNRKAGPFVAINCAAVPQTLIESELFGHSRGAFTDAKAERTGLFLQATGGTLFLDEIAELPLEMQPKLLRALQERKVRPVGSNTEVPFDVRLVTATTRDLEYEVFQKRFREDLFYRVNVVTIEVPPLRERPGDVLLLAQHFLKRFAGVANKPMTAISETAAEKLVNYEWPGNVRELENCIERGVALGRFDQLTVEDLPQKVRGYRAPSLVVSADDRTEGVVME